MQFHEHVHYVISSYITENQDIHDLNECGSRCDDIKDMLISWMRENNKSWNVRLKVIQSKRITFSTPDVDAS